LARLRLLSVLTVEIGRRLLNIQWAAERQQYFGDSVDITDVFQDSDNLVKFLIFSRHLTPPSYIATGLTGLS